LKQHEYAALPADELILGDLRDPAVVRRVVEDIYEVYQRNRGIQVRVARCRRRHA